MLVNMAALAASAPNFATGTPFRHAIVDSFFTPDVAYQLENEFPEFDSMIWHEYDNAIEVKKTSNNWNAFPPLTYRVFSYLNSPEFVAELEQMLGVDQLSADPGLHGGGLHIHRRGGKLNTHLDYSLHPKLGKQRKLNIIVYLNRHWKPTWGGQLGFWAQHPDREAPGALVQSIDPVFNRAVIFDTTQQSWHGLPDALTCPAEETRRSLAIYYLVPAPVAVDPRGKALYAPTAEQQGDREVLELIRVRSDVNSAASVWRA